MDFLNRTFEQIKDVFASMTPGARITAGLLLVVIIVSVTFLFQGQISTGNNYLFGGRGFSTAELEAIESAFAKAGLSDYDLESNRVRLPASNKAEYIAALAEHNALPENFSDIFARASNAANPFENKQQAEQRWRTAKQQELALVIKHINGVAMAQVIYDEVEKPGFPRKIEKTATVAVKAEGTAELEQHQIKAVRHLVSAAFAGLAHEDVTVTDLNTGRTFGGGGEDFASIDQDPYFERKQFYEKLWRDKIQHTVSFVPGAEVTVDVTLNQDTLLRESTVAIDPKPVTLESNTIEKTSTNNRNAPRGRPGTVAQQNGSANQASSIGGGPRSESTDDETRENLRRIPGHTQTVRDKAALVPEKVTAVIGIPSDYYEMVWKERNPPVPGEEPTTPEVTQIQAIEQEVIKKIEDMVVNLIPQIESTEDKFPLVKVKTVESLTAAAIPEPAITQIASGWLADNWSTLGMMLAGVFGLLMLRSMVKQRPQSPTSDDTGAPNLSIVGAEDDDDDENEETPGRQFANAGANVKEELASMVRQNPDAAANILKSWIGEAS